MRAPTSTLRRGAARCCSPAGSRSTCMRARTGAGCARLPRARRRPRPAGLARVVPRLRSPILLCAHGVDALMAAVEPYSRTPARTLRPRAAPRARAGAPRTLVRYGVRALAGSHRGRDARAARGARPSARSAPRSRGPSSPPASRRCSRTVCRLRIRPRSGPGSCAERSARWWSGAAARTRGTR